MATTMREALQAALDQGQHADGCGWWDTPAFALADPARAAAAEAACNCYLALAREALTPPTACRMCVAAAQSETPPAYRVTVQTPNGEESAAICARCWDAEGRALPVSTWEDALGDRLAGVPDESDAAG